MTEPTFYIPAARGSDAWQEGKRYIELPASEVTDEDIEAMEASERAFWLQWVDRHPFDHEQATARDEDECAASAAE